MTVVAVLCLGPNLLCFGVVPAVQILECLLFSDLGGMVCCVFVFFLTFNIRYSPLTPRGYVCFFFLSCLVFFSLIHGFLFLIICSHPAYVFVEYARSAEVPCFSGEVSSGPRTVVSGCLPVNNEWPRPSVPAFHSIFSSGQ